MLKRLSSLWTPCTAIAAVFVVLGGGTARAETVTVFAAASLKAALDDVTHDFEQATEHTINVSYAGSSTLARQIERGASANVFISANVDWMDWIEGQDLLQPNTRKALLTNELVLVAPIDVGQASVPLNSDAVLDFLDETPLAMGFVDAVPAGIYGKAALSSLGLWEDLASHVAQTDNVRSALSLVARGEARLGIVYATDAQAEPTVRVVARFPSSTHAPIVYPAAIVAPQTQGAQDFAAYLASTDARARFEAHGFGVYAP